MAVERIRAKSNHPGFGHPVGRPPGLVKAVLLAIVLIAGSPVQAAAQTILDDILARVNAAVSAASGARAAAEEMRTRLRSGVNDLTADLQVMIAEAAAEARLILAEEKEGRDAFLPSGECAAACTAFRNDLIALLTNLETLSKSVIESTGLSADPDLSKLIESVRVAPGKVLFPLYRVTQALLASDLPERLALAANHVRALTTLVLNGPPELPDACALIAPRTTEIERAVRGVSVVGALVKLVGKVFLAVGETEFEGYAGGWGFVGGTIKSNKKKTVGELLTGVSDAMSKVAGYANGKLDLCALLAFREGTEQSLASISASLSRLNLDLSHLDVPVSTRASQASVDGLDGSLKQVGVEVAALIDAHKGPGGGDASALMLRIQIERGLADSTSAMPVFYLPELFGGLLETVRGIVEQNIVQHQAAGIVSLKAWDLLSRGDAARIEGDYLKSYSWYQAAYQGIVGRQPGQQAK